MAKKLRPCIWLHLDGFTFRWVRGDAVMIVQRGQHRGHDDVAVVARIPVSGEWQDSADVRRRANYWLAQQGGRAGVTPPA